MYKNLLEIYYSYNVSEHLGYRIVKRYSPDAQIGQQLKIIKDVHVVDGTEIVRAIEDVSEPA